MCGHLPNIRFLLVTLVASSLMLSACGDCGGTPADADAGSSTDAHSTGDASTDLDAAVDPDSAVVPDAAIEPDSAVDPDAAVENDAAGQDAAVDTDATVEDATGVDAALEDGGAGSDAASAEDAAVPCTDTAGTIDSSGSAPWNAAGNVVEDRLTGSCTAGYPGSDALLRFVAPYAGTFRFSTAGSSFDTLVYLRSDCADSNSELACNDQIGLSSQAQVEASLADQQAVYVVIDSYRDSASKSFVLTIHDAQAIPVPSITALQATCSLDPNALGLVASGLAPGDDLGFMALQLLDSAGSPTPMHGSDELELALDGSPFVDFNASAGAFALQFSAPMETPLVDVASVSLRLASRSGDYGPALTVACNLPPELTSGAECDPEGGLNTCLAGQRCSTEAGPTVPATCVDATPPTLTQAGAAFNSSRRTLGVSAEGQDLEHNAWYARVVLLDGEMAPLRQDPLDDQSPLLDPVYIELQLSWVGDGYAGRGSRPMPATIPPGAHFEALRIEVVDRTGLQSTSADAVVSDPLSLLSGDPCDFAQAFGICPGAELCGYDDGNVGSATFCQVIAAACPVEWPVVALNGLLAGTGTWLHTASLAETTNYGGLARCGGGGPQVVASFLAPETGTYLFELSASSADPLLFSRSHCTLPQPEFELACHDDVDLQHGEFGAENRLQLQAAEQVYLFADGYIDQDGTGLAGDYELRATFEGSAP